MVTIEMKISMKKIIAITCILGFISGGLAKDENYCGAVKCVAGDKGVTYASKEAPYYACPTRELSDYVSFVVSLIGLSYEMIGRPPNISDKTGEPEYSENKDHPDETNLLIKMFREKAAVSTFYEALEQCKKGRGQLKVTILNSDEKDGDSIWVVDEKTRHTFWMPAGNLDKIENQ